ncbi:hypothetical protein GS610_17845 [Ruegeria sp. HKCCD6228]|uniref:hypothetical protein n=1 Tax=unclassified Ruegeria TaxID=2625375 RepID=UPI001490BB3C|nr:MULTISPECIES: hypothetical protein [unclassified Ruegeria]NOC85369.1 hypothetical protein [Ruegeria sp. HKCCD6428]NOD99068.1 hypothetical protein [Ruegeria sp. HKCCD6228]
MTAEQQVIFNKIMEDHDDEDYARKLMNTGSLSTGHVPPIALCQIPGGVFHLNRAKFWRV